jgi:adenylate kinase family enzyme
MKINIIGPTGSGKTTLADTLSKKLNIQVTSLDYLFYKHTKEKQREEILEKVWKKELGRILKKQEWIIEGVNPINEVIETADLVIYLRPHIAIALYRQWKRYFTDSKQRKEHGFGGNLKLSQYLFKQYLENDDITSIDDIKYSRLKKLDRILEKHANKVRVINNNTQLKQLILLVE